MPGSWKVSQHHLHYNGALLPNNINHAQTSRGSIFFGDFLEGGTGGGDRFPGGGASFDGIGMGHSARP